MAADAHEAIYRRVRHGVGLAGLPPDTASLSTEDRRRLRVALADGWPEGVETAYMALTHAVSDASAARWAGALGAGGDREAMFWRLVRMGERAVLRARPGRRPAVAAADRHPLGLAAAVPPRGARHRAPARWPAPGGMAGPGTRQGHRPAPWSWPATSRSAGATVASGRRPEAKVYLDVAHHEVPGYFPLDPVPAAEGPARAPATSDRPPGGGTEPLRLFEADEEPAQPD